MRKRVKQDRWVQRVQVSALGWLACIGVAAAVTPPATRWAAWDQHRHMEVDSLFRSSGEPNASRSSYPGLGLFRSDDGGNSFRPIGLDDVDRIARIVVNPSNSRHGCGRD